MTLTLEENGAMLASSREGSMNQRLNTQLCCYVLSNMRELRKYWTLDSSQEKQISFHEIQQPLMDVDA
jgi:hypothetical protein